MDALPFGEFFDHHIDVLCEVSKVELIDKLIVALKRIDYLKLSCT